MGALGHDPRDICNAETDSDWLKLCNNQLAVSFPPPCARNHSDSALFRNFLAIFPLMFSLFEAAGSRARNEVRGTIMCASVFPGTHKNIEGVFVGAVVPILCTNVS